MAPLLPKGGGTRRPMPQHTFVRKGSQEPLVGPPMARAQQGQAKPPVFVVLGYHRYLCQRVFGTGFFAKQ